MDNIQFIKPTKIDIKQTVKLVASGVPYSVARLKVLQNPDSFEEIDELLSKEGRVIKRILLETIDNRYEYAINYLRAEDVIDLHLLHIPEDGNKIITNLNNKLGDLTRQLDEITIHDFNEYDLDNLFLAMDILGVIGYEHRNSIKGLSSLLNKLYSIIYNTDINKVEYNDNLTIEIALLTQTCKELLDTEVEEDSRLKTTSIFG